MTRKRKLQVQGQKLKKILQKLDPNHHLLVHGTLGQGKSSEKAPTRKEVQECLRKLKKRMKGHDFLAEILDDAFQEHVVERAREYLTDKEYKTLNNDETEDLAAGVQIVVDEFLRWLSPKRK